MEGLQPLLDDHQDDKERSDAEPVADRMKRQEVDHTQDNQSPNKAGNLPPEHLWAIRQIQETDQGLGARCGESVLAEKQEDAGDDEQTSGKDDDHGDGEHKQHARRKPRSILLAWTGNPLGGFHITRLAFESFDHLVRQLRVYEKAEEHVALCGAFQNPDDGERAKRIRGCWVRAGVQCPRESDLHC